jgi:hypothetical protein
VARQEALALLDVADRLNIVSASTKTGSIGP